MKLQAELDQIGAPFTVVCSSVSGLLFKITETEFMKTAFRDDAKNKQTIILNLQTKFKAIESKTQCLQYYSG